jgi:DNA-binding NarL/FixJ family response regulator
MQEGSAEMYSNFDHAAVSVCSSHPLAAQILKEAIVGSRLLDLNIRVLTRFHELKPREEGELLFLDGCCDADWPKPTLQWQKNGGKVMVLLSAQAAFASTQLRALFLGVRGVIVAAGIWQREVPQAIIAVLEGKLWIDREILDEYISRLTGQGRNHSSDIGPQSQLTAREEQIMSLLLRGDSNKEIANALGIAERTVKYHVSNILQKSQVSSRRELFENMTKNAGVNELSNQLRRKYGQMEAEAAIAC